MALLLSILTPAVPSRWWKTQALVNLLSSQIGDLPVEHLVLLDNKRRTVGEKRDALLRAAHGEYIAFVDDDDTVSADYVSSLLTAAEPHPDVITFDQSATIDGQKSIITFGLRNPNETFIPDVIIRRNAWHICAWRRELAILSHFPALNYGEDWAFAEKLCGLANLREIHIPRVLHYYNYDSTLTEASHA